MKTIIERWSKLPHSNNIKSIPFWVEIEKQYTASSRYYHTLHHLESMFAILDEYYNGSIPVATQLATFYHDFEYSVLRKDNEKQSAEVASQQLEELGYDKILVAKVVEMIMFTANHDAIGVDEDIKVFLDADMMVLGITADMYKEYISNVRKEYSIYPDFMYNRGRLAFLKKLIKAPFIYQTDFFRTRYEQSARQNIINEINQLS